jgi:hypothetical protein
MHTLKIATLTALLICAGTAAFAQQPSAPLSSQGPLVLEPMKNGLIIAPDVKVTKFDGQVGTLAGAYGGWLNDDRLLIGAGGYWLADGKNGRSLAYGGLVVGWRVRPDRSIGFGVKGLIGLGESSRSVAVDDFLVRGPDMPTAHIDVDRLDTRNRRVRFHEDVFVAEPEVDLHVKLVDSIRLTLGAGYRAVNNSNGFNKGLRGPTGTVSVQFNLR